MTESAILVAAVTPSKNYKHYPPYLNVKKAGDNVIIILRGNEAADGACGSVVEATIPLDDFIKFIAEARNNL